jgi:dTDP-4-amino-4,6-dideoxy-D-galactose acyltransferase
MRKTTVKELFAFPPNVIKISEKMKSFFDRIMKGNATVAIDDRLCIAAAVSQDRKWDTDFFGIKTAAIFASVMKSPQYDERLETCVRDQIHENLQRSIKLIISRCSLEDTEVIRALEIVGFRSYDFGVRFEITTSQVAPSKPTGLELSFAEESDVWPLMSIAGRIYEFGHFHQDRKFDADAANAMNAIWIRNLFYSENTSIVVAKVDSRIVGFASLRNDQEKTVIDLFGVLEEHRDKGIGKQLIRWALASLNPGTIVYVGTQMSNRPAIALYLNAGFNAVEYYVTLHLWAEDFDM